MKPIPSSGSPSTGSNYLPLSESTDSTEKIPPIEEGQIPDRLSLEGIPRTGSNEEEYFYWDGAKIPKNNPSADKFPSTRPDPLVKISQLQPLSLCTTSGEKIFINGLDDSKLNKNQFQELFQSLNFNSKKELFWALCYYNKAESLTALKDLNYLSGLLEEEEDSFKTGILETIKSDALEAFLVFYNRFPKYIDCAHFGEDIDKSDARRILEHLCRQFF